MTLREWTTLAFRRRLFGRTLLGISCLNLAVCGVTTSVLLAAFSVMIWDWDINPPPVWAGLVLIVSFYGLILMVPVAVLAAFVPRRSEVEFLRRSEGRCHRCRYELAGQVGGYCPECGTRQG